MHEVANIVDGQLEELTAIYRPLLAREPGVDLGPDDEIRQDTSAFQQAISAAPTEAAPGTPSTS